ncbi:unnamed protein product [Rotaria sordida]|uniref:Deltamethrin resistance protein prag01 domain-containing protein n=1 Tax=Rotaria sordida TaxID=392033 RepID=A0A814N8P7_9BILA|nr:unnamed protein product [Rotaria sordida]CAF0814565.1 unnamed protein product [Rotaria sordida]CAF0990856.1 unnamed protein product [Rotaria sordida]CAF1028790.1 unnamed protein product [Rotaria sordida]CAF1088159.1 unnamed protein product [Rotaria sordida]
MLARVLNSNATTTIAKRILTTNNIRMIDSHRYKSYGSSEVQHGSSHHGEVDHHGHHGHHDPYKMMYERLWQNKSTLDWLPKPEGSWQEINEKQQAYYNKILITGILAFTLACAYFRVVVVGDSGALTKPPYHLIGNEDFPGSKYEDAVGAKQE